MEALFRHYLLTHFGIEQRNILENTLPKLKEVLSTFNETLTLIKDLSEQNFDQTPTIQSLRYVGAFVVQNIHRFNKFIDSIQSGSAILKMLEATVEQLLAGRQSPREEKRQPKEVVIHNVEDDSLYEPVPEVSPPLPSLGWQTRQLHRDLSVHASLLRRVSKKSSGFATATINMPLSVNHSIRWKIRIVNIQENIRIGVCELKSGSTEVMTHYFKTLSLKTTAERRQPKWLKFVKNGIIIVLTYLPTEEKLLFESNRGTC